MIWGTRDGRTAGRADRKLRDERADRELRDERADRGQTTVDFAIAIGLFLIALTIVISFLPAMIDPFAGTPSENPLIADRIANQLTDYQLAGEASGTLNATCTVYFFNESSPSCSSWSDDDETINEQLGIEENIRVNVSVEQNVSEGESEPLCGDREEHRVLDQEDCDPNDDDQYLLTVGEPLPTGGTVATARRGVYLDGRQSVILYVQVWQIT